MCKIVKSFGVSVDDCAKTLRTGIPINDSFDDMPLRSGNRSGTCIQSNEIFVYDYLNPPWEEHDEKQMEPPWETEGKEKFPVQKCFITCPHCGEQFAAEIPLSIFMGPCEHCHSIVSIEITLKPVRKIIVKPVGRAHSTAQEILRKIALKL